MATRNLSPQELVAIVDRAVLPVGREVDLPVHRSRTYVVVEGEVVLVATDERCGPGTVLEPTRDRLVLRAVTAAVLGVVTAGRC